MALRYSTRRPNANALPMTNGFSVRKRHRSSKSRCCFGRSIIGTAVTMTFGFLWMHSVSNSRDELVFRDIERRTAESTNEPYFDVVIAGAGPAGLTAALFCARAGLSTLVTGSDAGQLSEAIALSNFPGSKYAQSPDTEGSMWLKTAKEQAAAAGAHFAVAGLLVNHIESPSSSRSTTTGFFDIDVSDRHVFARSVIVATGATSRRLQLPHEDTLWGKAVHSCAICDGSAYYDGKKTVVVVGGGDAAADAALLIARQAYKVIVVHRRSEFTIHDQNNLKAMLATPNIEISEPATIEEYVLDQSANVSLIGVRVRHVGDKTTQMIQCDGVFLMIGSSPNTLFLKDTVELEQDGLISINDKYESSVPGIFAAGEVIDNTYKQAITAAGSGAASAISAERWLRLKDSGGDLSSVTRSLPNNVPLQDIADKSKEIHLETVKSTDSQYNCDLIEATCITTLVHKYSVVVFSKESCPHCRKVLEILEQEQVLQERMHVVILSEMELSRAQTIQATLGELTGRLTVPNVFIGGKSIGGGTETVKLKHAGELRGLLIASGAIQEDKADCDLTTEECIMSLVNKFPVVIFSKPWCPFCQMAVEAFGQENVKEGSELHVVDLTTIKRGSLVQSKLKQLTGRRTVPNVFVGGKPIGGGDETVAMQKSGALRILLDSSVHGQ